MAEPLTFPSTTPNHDLPLLFAGQAQKEMSLNQATAVIDALLCATITQSTNTPPAQAAEGAVYRVVPIASEGWAGKEDHLAVRVGSSWHFVTPRTGMRFYDTQQSKVIVFETQWNATTELSPAQGGSVVDVEARALLGDLIEQLRNIGIFSRLG